MVQTVERNRGAARDRRGPRAPRRDAPPAAAPGASRTYRLLIEYEGTRYHGWQEQKNARTVAGELRQALEKVIGPLIELGGSGRTDAGVHALGQVAHARIGAAAPDLAAKLHDLNEELPPDIHVLDACRVGDRFHARHAATARAYVYQISSRRTAFAKRFVWWVRDSLDRQAMASAAAVLVGRHDFAAFSERPEEQKSTVVEVHSAEVGAEGDLVLIRLVASHFLWKMVRRLVGGLVEVGRGDLSIDDFSLLVESGAKIGDRDPARWTAPPSGLFLERVLYPGLSGFPPLRSVIPVGTAELPPRERVAPDAGGGRPPRRPDRASGRGPAGRGRKR